MANITFNLDESIIQFIKSFAKEYNITQKEVVEMSLKEQIKRKMVQEIENESKELWSTNKDELLFIADSGLTDYNNLLKNQENGN